MQKRGLLNHSYNIPNPSFFLARKHFQEMYVITLTIFSTIRPFEEKIILFLTSQIFQTIMCQIRIRLFQWFLFQVDVVNNQGR